MAPNQLAESVEGNTVDFLPRSQFRLNEYSPKPWSKTIAAEKKG